MLRSFRLSEEAAASLERLAQEYKTSANKIINIILTQEETTTYLQNPKTAATIMEEYFTEIIAKSRGK